MTIIEPRPPLLKKWVYTWLNKMATLTDRLVGALLILLATGVFSYYTVWVIILPFLEKDHFLQGYFLSRWYAVGLPIAAGIILVTMVGIFVGIVLIKEQTRKKKKT